jgi:hypothetical protein
MYLSLKNKKKRGEEKKGNEDYFCKMSIYIRMIWHISRPRKEHDIKKRRIEVAHRRGSHHEAWESSRRVNQSKTGRTWTRGAYRRFSGEKWKGWERNIFLWFTRRDVEMLRERERWRERRGGNERRGWIRRERRLRAGVTSTGPAIRAQTRAPPLPRPSEASTRGVVSTLCEVCVKVSGEEGRMEGMDGLTGEWSNNSMNCWSMLRDLGNAYRRYSSKIAVEDQCCSFRKQPTKQPVRCFKEVEKTTTTCAHQRAEERARTSRKS